MSYNQKKFLDYDGLIHLLKKFDDYPTNDILGTVIDSIGTAIDAKVSDVQIEGNSILENGIANIPLANATNLGLVTTDGTYGLFVSNGILRTSSAPPSVIKPIYENATDIMKQRMQYRPITPQYLNEAVFYGFAKAAGDATQSQSSNAVGTYTNEAKAAIQTMLDVPSNATVTSAIGTAIGNVHQFSIEVVQALPTENIQEHTVYFVPKTGETNDVYDEYVYVNNGWEMIGNTQIDLSNYVQKTDYPSSTQSGVVKISDSYGIYKTGDNTLRTWAAAESHMKEGTNAYRPIVPLRQDYAAFYGLAKAACADEKNSNLAFGTYSDTAKTAIRSMLGAVGNTDYATANTGGVIKVNSNYGITMGNDGQISVYPAGLDQIKAATNVYRTIGPSRQHFSVFYGLARAAGDTTQNQSSNAVGTYTDEAKDAIQNMLGISSLISARETSTATTVHTANSLFLMNGKLYRATIAIAIGDAVVEGQNCEVVKMEDVFVKKTDMATSNDAGVVKVNSSNGVALNNSGVLTINRASSPQIKAASSGTAPITAYVQHEATFYGLAKAAGDTTQSQSDNAVGTYTDNAKTAIRSMLGAVGTTDYATESTGGVIKVGGALKIVSDSGVAPGVLYVKSTSVDGCKAGINGNFPVTPEVEHASTFYGLAKAAGANMASSSNPVGTYTDAAKIAIRNMIGATSNKVVAIQDEQPTDTDTKVWLPETQAAGVQVPTMEDMENYVQKTDYATSDNAGVIKVGARLTVENNKLLVRMASTSNVKGGTSNDVVITPGSSSTVAFYGLAKAAGDTTQASSDNAVGTYTTGAKTAIRSMIGAVGDVQVNGTSVVSNEVANIPLASTTNLGIIGLKAASYGISISSDGYIYINSANTTHIKAGTSGYLPITPYTQEYAVFYGLTKAAGVDMASSSNAVGTYTAEAKSAIQSMLGVESGVSFVENISGTTPIIIGEANTRYMCGELSLLDVTPPQIGTIDIIFSSGSTPTVLTLPSNSTIKWPEWFDPTALTANMTYEINIMDNQYGAVMIW